MLQNRVSMCSASYYAYAYSPRLGLLLPKAR